jgi:type II restriction enzyme
VVRLQLPINLLEKYKSSSQRARVATEAWAAEELFCPSCTSNSVDVLPTNTRAHDFRCPRCTVLFQLKSQSRKFGTRILDAEYHSALSAIREDRSMNLLALQYNKSLWRVVNLFLVPSFAISESMVVPRKPLRPTARRAGWTGCSFLLAAIAPDLRISYIREGEPIAPKFVREQFAALRPLKEIPVKERGWTLDVLNAIRSLKSPDFALADVYSFEHRLSALHPNNRHVRDKIRQQLQVLRDAGLLSFSSRGHYRLRSAAPK